MSTNTWGDYNAHSSLSCAVYVVARQNERAPILVIDFSFRFARLLNAQRPYIELPHAFTSFDPLDLCEPTDIPSTKIESGRLR
eukprot:256666-Pyramimonas_sp.AAC.1